MPWFMEQIRQGFFAVVNPFNRKTSRVPASPEHVHAFVFWSKNFKPFLDGTYGDELTRQGYHLYFQFTINSADPLLEPGVPALAERFDQLADLCGRFGAAAVNWRFDPICMYADHRGGIHDNLADFGAIARTASGLGITRCTSSFMDAYAKIRRRIPAPGIEKFIEMPGSVKQKIALDLNERLRRRGIRLDFCCEKELLALLPPEKGIASASCIPNDRLMELYGGRVSRQKDTGQRQNQGCGCRVSVDVGDYLRHPCFHNCLFCYANPAQWSRTENGSRR